MKREGSLTSAWERFVNTIRALIRNLIKFYGSEGGLAKDTHIIGYIAGTVVCSASE